MDRSRAQRDQHKTAMRTGRIVTIWVLPQGGGRKRDKPGTDAVSGRGLYGDAVLRDTSNDGGSASERIPCEPQTYRSVAATDGAECIISKAAIKQKRSGAQDISVFIEGIRVRASEPSMVKRYNVYTATAWVRVSGSGNGLVQPLRIVMGVVADDGDGFLCFGVGMGVKGRETGNLQQRSGFSVHQRGFHRETARAWNTNQHGWAWAGIRQHFYRTALENGEVRGCLPEELRKPS